MAARTDSFDLGRLRLTLRRGPPARARGRARPAAVRRRDVRASSPPRSTRSSTSRARRTTATRCGCASTRRSQGPCMRCLEPARPAIAVDAREVDQPGDVEELRSPYVEDEVLDLHAWARDALALALPVQLLCRADCAGLCPVCGDGPQQRRPRARARARARPALGEARRDQVRVGAAGADRSRCGPERAGVRLRRQRRRRLREGHRRRGAAARSARGPRARRRAGARRARARCARRRRRGRGSRSSRSARSSRRRRRSA